MIDHQNRSQMRAYFKVAWKKYTDRIPTEPIETIIGEVISIHPEYQAMLESDHEDLDKDYQPENGQTNPFLHMGMHISLREQYNSDRPAGILLLYKKILMKTGDIHQTEHLIMDCLGESLWQAQRKGQLPDETAYLNCIKRVFNTI